MSPARDTVRDTAQAVGRAVQLSQQVTAQIDAIMAAGSEREAEPPVQVHGPHVVLAATPDTAAAAADASPGSAAAQRHAHLGHLANRLNEQTPSSKSLTQRHRAVLADSRAYVGFRPGTKEMHYPIVGRRAHGAQLEDVDGNTYVDITMGFGALLFGHDPDFVGQAVQEQLSRGLLLGARSEDTGEAAALLSELTGMERIAFAVSGTEANSAAIRLARAATGRTKLVMFRGSYHGHIDSVLGRPAGRGDGAKTLPVSPGIPASAVAELMVLEYGSTESLQFIEEHADGIAAVLVEPVQCRNPSLRPAAFVTSLREITRRHGIVLVFDEMLTGFRPCLGGAQEYYDVTPDLATYGKAIGGGYPLGVIAGRADIMDGVDGGFWRYGDDSGPQRETTFFGGTYLQHPVAMAAARAVLTHLRRHSPELQQRLNTRTDHLARTLNEFFTAEEFPIRLEHFGSMFRFSHRADMELFYRHLLLRGLYVWEWRSFYLSTAHTDRDTEFIAEAVTGSLRELRDAGMVRSRPVRSSRPTSAPAPDFSVYFFGDYPPEEPVSEGPDGRYELITEIARFADQHDFHALWMPERHFHSFGALFPSPAVLAAALARETRRIRLNAGSVVLPLHDPIRVAEEWSAVDNLSGGRVGIGCASGWHADDFVFCPDDFGPRKKKTYEHLDTVRRLWRGETIRRRNGAGQEIDVRIFPRPVQRCPPMFLATTGSPDSFEQAGQLGLGIVTNLMKQTIEQLTANIAHYRRARAAQGLDPATGRVAVLLHTYVGADQAAVRAEALDPMRSYLRSSLDMRQAPGAAGPAPASPAPDDPADLDYLLERAYSRYCDQRALIGTPERCAVTVEALRDAGVNEVAALVDFGLPADRVRSGLDYLDQLRRRFHGSGPAPAPQQSVPATTERSGPATAPQRRIWLACQLTGPSAYNEIQAARLRGPLDVSALRTAIRVLAERHDALRTVFRPDGPEGTLRQVVRAQLEIPLTIADARDEDPVTAIRDAIQRRSEQERDLAEGPLFAPALLRLGPGDHVLILSVHHIITDAHTAGIIAADLAEAYRAAVEGREARFGAPAGSALAAAPDDAAADPAGLAWWREHLGDHPPVLRLPADRPRTRPLSGRGGCVSVRLGADHTAKLQAWSAGQRVTMLAAISTAWQIVLRRFSGQDEFVLGSTSAGRVPATADIVGFFAVLLPLRCRLSGQLSLGDAARATRDVLLSAREHAQVPMDELLAMVNPDPGSARPLTPVSVDLGGEALAAMTLPGIDIEAVDADSTAAPLELALMATRSQRGLRLSIRYDAGLFTGQTARRYLAHLEDVLSAMADGHTSRIDDLPLLTAGDRDDLGRWGGEQVAPVADPPRLGDLPPGDDGRAAVVHGPATWGRGQLRAAADAIAARLAERGVGRGDVVAIMLPRTPAFVAAVLGTVRSGAAYLPLDLAQPPRRLAAMLADAAPAALICADAETPVVGADLPRVPVSAGAPAGPREPPAGPAPGAALEPDDLLCLLYTSGSTGSPKGVALEQGNMAAVLAACREELSYRERDRVAWYSSVGFDLSHLELWSALMTGAELHIVPDDIRLDPARLAAWLVSNEITVAWLPTVMGEAVLQQPWPEQARLRWLGVGGEQLNAGPRPGLPFTLLNIYGPTECTVFCTRSPVTPGQPGPPPIGTPVPGMCLEVRSPDGRLLPPGAVGELHIGGPQVSRGYYGDPGLTASRFTSAGGRRWFRSGDLVRWGPDGCLYFAGRNDDQVQVRGVRVEPAEVAQAVRQLPGIRDARVAGSADAVTGQGRLRCYVVPDGAVDDPEAQITRWRAQLAAWLPRPMVPQDWTLTGQLPTTANGKWERPAVPPGEAGQEAVPPDHAGPAALRDHWSAVLETASDFPDDASFFDLGGHSVSAIRLLNLVRETFGAEYPMSAFFQDPTVRGMTARLTGAGPAGEKAGNAGNAGRERGEL